MSVYTKQQDSMISDGQRRCIYALSRKAGMDNDPLHAMIENHTGLGSVNDMSWEQAKHVIDRLRDILGEEEPANRANKKQLHVIYGLAAKLGWDDHRRLNRFCEARFGISHPKFADDDTTIKIIEALKAMLKGNRGERRSRERK